MVHYRVYGKKFMLFRRTRSERQHDCYDPGDRWAMGGAARIPGWIQDRGSYAPA